MSIGQVGLVLQGGIQVVNQTHVDPYYGPYNSVTDANNNVPVLLRVCINNGVTIGRTVGVVIAGVSEDYWWVNGSLVLKVANVAGVEKTINKGIANGYAPLGADSRVPAIHLPAYVAEIIEVASFAALPLTGVGSVIYVTVNDNKQYRWGGSAYSQISASPGTTDDVSEGALITRKYFSEVRVIATVLGDLTGFIVNNAINATDNIKQFAGKLQGQINAILVSISDLYTTKADKSAVSNVVTLLQNNIDQKLNISDYNPGASTLTQILTNNNNAGGLKIINLADPTLNQDAATKAYVDSRTSTSVLTSKTATINYVTGQSSYSFPNLLYNDKIGTPRLAQGSKTKALNDLDVTPSTITIDFASAIIIDEPINGTIYDLTYQGIQLVAPIAGTGGSNTADSTIIKADSTLIIADAA